MTLSIGLNIIQITLLLRNVSFNLYYGNLVHGKAVIPVLNYWSKYEGLHISETSTSGNSAMLFGFTVTSN